MKTPAQVQRLQEELKRAIDQRDVFARELAKMLQHFEEKVRELSVIRRIGESLKYTRDVRKVFEVIIGTIMDDTNAENCSLMLLNRETGELTVKAARGQSDAVSSYFHTADRTGRTFRLGEGIAGWVAQHGEPLSIPDVSAGTVVPFYPELDEQGEPVPITDLSRNPQFVFAPDSAPPIGSLLCLPLVIDKEVVGVVNLSHPRPHAFSPVDQRVMTIITDQVAIALNSVQIFDDLQHLNLVLEEEVNRATEEMRRTNRELQVEISERERAERALRIQTEQLFQAQKMEAVGTLAGGIAHDFNNLLTQVIGFAELALIEPDHSPRWREYIARLPENAQRAARLISQLLTFSRQAATEPQALQLLHLIKETMKMLERTVPENISLRMKISPDVALVNADPTQMQQVILNLCINASHAMPNGGELTVGLENVTLDGAYCQQYACARPGDYVCLSVRDTGVGMAPEVQKRIFEPFFTTKGVGEGTGLGLAMVYGIVKSHEGHIHVTSEVEKGSEFRVYLPAMNVGATLVVAPEQESPVGGTETILMVEDQAEVLDAGQAMLEGLGYRVMTATNGEEAIEVYRAHRAEIDLVLTDMVMPKMGGQALYEALRQIDPAVKAVLMSGYSLKQDVDDLRAGGLKGFVQKPFNFVRLSRAVRQALDEQT
ncbi:MAG: hypothetical protein A3F84_24140 [Candidatus Handelsmanbacteria bacterium RIFCSPLOWO2_12_FULL_64_10]|uniref:histidine kinase n=1 Tax=Handelsmanbacteria sp. (strain RIFCSPLOWO2_12_FULL_64_10) TaxID=1817868 RepID=A0A1F6CBE6_HANXR|nr:MAG: hypothetical protein A3F84_24140 [Candidatus Handelsmanbacteria bacterium RIFCSPLOWO2_12_FULL_64_10]